MGGPDAQGGGKTAEVADGWIPIYVIPEKVGEVWGPVLQAGLARRGPERLPFETSVAVIVAIGEDLPVRKLPGSPTRRRPSRISPKGRPVGRASDRAP